MIDGIQAQESIPYQAPSAPPLVVPPSDSQEIPDQAPSDALLVVPPSVILGETHARTGWTSYEQKRADVLAAICVALALLFLIITVILIFILLSNSDDEAELSLTDEESPNIDGMAVPRRVNRTTNTATGSATAVTEHTTTPQTRVLPSLGRMSHRTPPTPTTTTSSTATPTSPTTTPTMTPRTTKASQTPALPTLGRTSHRTPLRPMTTTSSTATPTSPTTTPTMTPRTTKAPQTHALPTRVRTSQRTTPSPTTSTSSTATPASPTTTPTTTTRATKAPQTHALPTWRRTSHRTTPSPTTTTSSTATPTNPTTTPTTTPRVTKAPRKPLLVGRLLCTLRSGFSRRTFVFPADGVCAITTFNSLFVAGGNTLSPPYHPDFEYFLKTATQHRETEYGIGIDHDFCRNGMRMNALVANQTTKTYLDELWSKRVYHYGQVNTPAIISKGKTLEYVTQSAKGLQMISELMRDKVDPEHRPSHTLLHYPLIYESMATDVAEALMTYSVDLLVAVGYVAYSDSRIENCRIVPPVLHSTELLEPFVLNNTYPIRLVRVISALATLKTKWATASEFAVSLGMGGRWYMPKYPDKLAGTPGNYSLGHECATTTRGDASPRDQISSIVEACEDPNYNDTFNIDSTFQALFSYVKADVSLFTYDSASTLRFKLCETKRNVTDLHYNIVADNIQYEDFNDVCGYGSYSRLRILKRLAAFLAENYTSPDHERSCNLVT